MPPPRGVSLLEVLAVVVIVAAASALLSAAMARHSSSDQLRIASEQWRHLDASARILSQRPEARHLRIHCNPQQRSWMVSIAGEQVLQQRWPEGIAVRIDAGSAEPAIALDTRGRSTDYRVRITAVENAQRVTWRCCGLTGWIEEEGL